jgi:hypothetical protein
VDTLDGLTDVSWRARWRRLRWPMIAIVAALIAIGAFLEWGPIGFGNGPLHMGADSVESGGISSRTPVAVLIPIGDGTSAVVIDDVQLLGNGSYPVPHVLAAEAMGYTVCGNLFPVRSAAGGFALVSCGGRPLGPLYGRAVGHGYPAIALAAFKIRPPRPGTCWLVTRIVTHYHVGIRHYVASDPYILAACAGSSAKANRIALAAAGTP